MLQRLSDFPEFSIILSENHPETTSACLYVSQRKVRADLYDYTLNLTSASHLLLLTENRTEIMSPRCVTNKEGQWRGWWGWWGWRGGREVVGELSGYFPVTSVWRDNRSLCEFTGRGGEQCDLRCGRHRLADAAVIIVWKRSDVGMMQTAFCLGSNWRNVWRKLICFGSKWTSE